MLGVVVHMWLVEVHMWEVGEVHMRVGVALRGTQVGDGQAQVGLLPLPL